MKKNHAILLSAVCLLFWRPTVLQAQYSFVAGGGSINGAAGKISYTIGNLVADATGDNGTLLSGMQLPAEIFWLSVAENGLPPGIRIFPNPTSATIIFEAEDPLQKNLSYQLFNSTGRLLYEGDIRNVKTEIKVSQFPPGIFLLRLSAGKQTNGNIKIIKTR